MKDRDIKVIEWFISGDSGLSSQTLCGCFYGIPPKNKYHPGDASDFGRCKSFLALLSPKEKKRALLAAGTLSPQWKALVEKWDYLEGIKSDGYLYDEMQKVLGEVRPDESDT